MVDQRAQGALCGRVLAFVVFQEVGQVVDRFAIRLCDCWREDDHILGVALAAVAVDRGALRSRVAQGVNQFGNVAAAGDGRHQIGDLLVEIREARGLATVEVGCFARQLLSHAHVGGNRRVDHIGAEQILAQASDDAALELGVIDLSLRCAGSLGPRRRAPPHRRIADDHRTAADAAADYARQQLARPFQADDRQPLRARFPRLDAVPAFAVDDREIGNRLALPLIERVEAGHAPAGVRIPRHRRAIVDHDAGVDLVAEDAVTALRIAIDRADRPFPACRRRHALRVDAAGDRERGIVGKIFVIYAADDDRLIGIDFPQSADRFAFRVQFMDLAVAIDDVASGAPFGDATAETAPDLVGVVLAKHRRLRADHADMKFADVTLRQGEDAGSRVTDMVEQPSHVALVAGKAVERFGEDLIGLAGLYMLEQLVEAGAIAHGARNCRVCEDARYRPAFTLRALHANPHLILDRAKILQGGAETGVDRGAHESGLLCWQPHGRASPSLPQ
ncbi:hypothetical protein V6U71_04855 [Sphingopyxis sp. J-6]